MKTECIPTNLLARYMEGAATAEEREQVESHLADCSTCREEFVLAGRMIREGLPQFIRKQFSGISLKVKVMEKFRGIISGWVEYLRPPLWILQTRNEEEQYPAVFFEADFDGQGVEIFVQRTGRNEGRVCIKPVEEAVTAADLRILIKREGGGTSARVLKDPLTYFDKILPFGICHIILKQGIKETCRSFEINESGIYER